MNFENIVIFPPDNYRFLNFTPIVINLYTLRLENLNIVWRSPLILYLSQKFELISLFGNLIKIEE